MSITGISSASGVTQTQQAQMSQLAKAMATKMVKDFDANKDGSLDKKEFVSGMVAKGMSEADATKTFDAIDSKKTGKMTTADLESAIKSGKMPRPSGPQAGAPAGGSAKAGGRGASEGKSYEAADTNEDGTVDSIEALVYEQKHAKVATGAQVSTTTAPASTLGNNVDQSV